MVLINSLGDWGAVCRLVIWAFLCYSASRALLVVGISIYQLFYRTYRSKNMSAILAKMPYVSYRCWGDDAATFLQGQLTQDINIITPERCHYGGYCNHKGRMFANILLYCDEQSDYLLRLHQRQAESVIERLRRFVLRADVKMVQVETSSIGLNKMAAQKICEQTGAELPDVWRVVALEGARLLALPGEYYELAVGEADIADAWLRAVVDDCHEDIDGIESLRLSGGNFNVLPETSELLLPQQTPLAAWGGISYDKGCYIGQEIIARNKYLGAVKKGVGIARLTPVARPSVSSSEHLSPQQLSLSASSPSPLPKTPVHCDGITAGQVIESGGDICLALLALKYLSKPCTVEGRHVSFQPLNSLPG